MQNYDIAVIGGGINGTGIARDLQGRGFSVYLCEQNDLAAGTSSKSTKLVHGGLRYLEQYEFRLVREALSEREVLMRNASHIIWPLRFVLPHMPEMRPSWMVRIGLFLYDNLGKRTTLPGSKRIDLTKHAAGEPLKISNKHAYMYSDCWLEDARMTVLNAMDAQARGARIETHTRLTKAEQTSEGWQLTTQNPSGSETIGAKALINAAGPKVNEILTGALTTEPKQNIRMIQGSHIVVDKIFDHEDCYIFQQPDGRIIFAIPYEQDYTLIGTTDHEVEDASNPQPTEGEITYLCEAASLYFKQPITRDQVVWAYAGVRPLYSEAGVDEAASKVSRDYFLERHPDTEQPLITVYGGKITTFRCLSEDAAGMASEALGTKTKSWTHDAPLPGGDLPQGFAAFQAQMLAQYADLPASLISRYAHYYGSRLPDMLGEQAPSIQVLGHHFGGDLYEIEVRFMMASEWATRAEDIVWRRSKQGLRMTNEQIQALDDWMLAQAA